MAEPTLGIMTPTDPAKVLARAAEVLLIPDGSVIRGQLIELPPGALPRDVVRLPIQRTETMSDWPEYVSHKKVKAAKIVGISPVDENGAFTVYVRPAGEEYDGAKIEEFEPTRADMKHAAEIGAYAVIYTPDEKYPDGYRSISPAKAFEEGYTRVEPTTLAEEKSESVLVTISDVIGAMAHWATVQHPYRRPEGLFDVIECLGNAALLWPEGVPSLRMLWAKDCRTIEHWLRSTLTGHPILEAWNTARSGKPDRFASRYGGPAPENDFIDIDALFRNVARSAYKQAKEER